VVYREGLNVGYRQHTTAGTDVLFPFGHGLSYTQFTYSDLQLSAPTLDAASATLELSVALQNAGSFYGAEVVQVYVRDVASSVHRPDRELRAFAKA